MISQQQDANTTAGAVTKITYQTNTDPQRPTGSRNSAAPGQRHCFVDDVPTEWEPSGQIRSAHTYRRSGRSSRTLHFGVTEANTGNVTLQRRGHNHCLMRPTTTVLSKYSNAFYTHHTQYSQYRSDEDSDTCRTTDREQYRLY